MIGAGGQPPALFRLALDRRFGRARRGTGRPRTILNHHVADVGNRAPGLRVDRVAVEALDRQLLPQNADLIFTLWNRDGDQLAARRRDGLHPAWTGAPTYAVDEIR